MPDSVFMRNAALRAELRARLETHPSFAASAQAEPDKGRSKTSNIFSGHAETMDVVVTLNEINDKHGTGPLLKRILKGRRDILSICSRNDWREQDFGDWRLRISQQGQTRPECFRNVLSVLGGTRVRTVLCVPFLIDEVLTSIAIKEAFGATLCTYIMDDQNIVAEILPDGIMGELLAKSSLRLATHPELRLAYEQKYGFPFFLLPAVVPACLVATEPVVPACHSRLRHGALLGSFWDQSWFDRLCTALEGCHCTVDWYGNNRSPWVEFRPDQLARARIQPLGIVPEAHLAEALRTYPFVIVPVGTLKGDDCNKGVAGLSLPGRILFAAATSHTPILVVGSRQTCGARFVEHFGIGEVVPYEAVAVADAIERLCRRAVQVRLRHNAARMAKLFTDEGVSEWLTASVERGEPADLRFEEAFSGYVAP